MGNDYVFIIRGTDDHYAESFKRLTESEILFSRVAFLYSDPALKEYAEEIASEVDLLPVGVCMAKEVEDPYKWIKENLASGNKISSRIVSWAPDVLLNPESVKSLGRILVRSEAAAVCATRDPNLRVDNIYEPTKTIPVEGKGLRPVDLLSKDFLIIRTKVLNELEFGDWFGLSLRKLGYQLWADMDANVDFVKTKKENKNAKDSDVEGLTRERQVQLV